MTARTVLGHDSAICINPNTHLKGEDCKKQPKIAVQLQLPFEVNPAPPRHPSSERFHVLLKELGELHDRKQQDYGSKDDPFANVRASTLWGTSAWVGALMRLNDKVVRLQRFARDKELANESAEDSMRDIAVYALIALVLYEEATREGG